MSSPIGRHGLAVADVQALVATAVGGERVATLVDGRLRTNVQVRYGRAARQTPQDLENLLLPVGNAGAWAQTAASAPAPMAAAPAPAMAMGGMGGMPAPAAAQPSTLQPGLPPPVVRLGDVARVVVREGSPMLKDENGSLVGYVFIDIDEERTDVGAWVDTARARVDKSMQDDKSWPAGIRLEWTGQYEFLVKMQARMRVMVPVTLLVIFLLLFLNFGNFAQPLLVLGTVPFALVGSVWLLWWLDFRLSTAVWVGLIALVGVAAETGIVMLMYLDEAYERRLNAGQIQSLADIQDAALEGAVQRVRPKLMTVAVNIMGLAPLLWAEGTGAEVMKRIAAPMVGGLVTSTFLTLEIIPVVYVAWRWRRWRSGADRPAVVGDAVVAEAA
jgi:Cu(I)/Ag(I) efflux system membrane protein CusA/SilA